VVQRLAGAIAIGHQPERAVPGLDVALVDALDGVFVLQTVPDQVLDRTDLQPVFAGERFQFRTPGHRTVRIEYLDQYAGRFHARQQGQVARRFGVSGTAEHAARLRLPREDVAGLRQVGAGCVRPHRGTHGVRAVVGADAGGHAFGGLDADREVGPVRRGVVAHHR